MYRYLILSQKEELTSSFFLQYSQLLLAILYIYSIIAKYQQFKMTASLLHTPQDREEQLDILRAMQILESNGYAVCDTEASENAQDLKLHPDSKRVGRWRAKMVDFCYEVADYCMSDRETVAIAMSFLDRFLRTPAGLEVCQNQDLFKLAAMTCHYTTIKIHEPPAVPPDVICEMSLGAFSVEQAEDMEFVILQSIDWRVNPPTAMAFLRQFLYLIPTGLMTRTVKESIYEASVEQMEMALRDRHFVKTADSLIAMSTLLNTLKSTTKDHETYVSIWSILLNAADMDSRIILETQRRLQDLVDSGGPTDEQTFDSTGSVDKFPCKRLFFGRSNSLLNLETNRDLLVCTSSVNSAIRCKSEAPVAA